MDNQSQKVPFKQYIWDGPFIVVRVLSNNNYTVRRIGTCHTQTLHRIRLRRYSSEKTIPDVKCRPDQWRPDPKTLITHDDIYAETWETNFGENPFTEATDSSRKQNETDIIEIDRTEETTKITQTNDESIHNQDETTMELSETTQPESLDARQNADDEYI